MLTFGLLIISFFIALIVLILLWVISEGEFFATLVRIQYIIFRIFTGERNEEDAFTWAIIFVVIELLCSPVLVFYLLKLL